MAENLIFFDNYFLTIFLMVILLVFLRQKSRAHSVSQRLFAVLCWAVILNAVTDALCYVVFPGSAESARAFRSFANAAFFVAGPIMPVGWLVYVDFNVFQSTERLKRRWFYGLPLLANLAAIVANAFTGWVFTVDQSLVYARGPGIAFVTAMCWLPMLYALALAVGRKSFYDTGTKRVLIFFSFLPLPANILQLAVNGTSLVIPSTAVALLIAFYILEMRHEARDFLTGLLNRQQIDDRIQERIANFSRAGAFSLVVIDLDDFKRINDTWGHPKGDEMLVLMANVLKRCTKLADDVGRYGGDEFILLLDSDEMDTVDQVVARLQEEIYREETLKKQPFGLRFSYGAVLYDPRRHGEPSRLFADADNGMYLAKRAKKRLDAH